MRHRSYVAAGMLAASIVGCSDTTGVPAAGSGGLPATGGAGAAGTAGAPVLPSGGAGSGQMASAGQAGTPVGGASGVGGVGGAGGLGGAGAGGGTGGVGSGGLAGGGAASADGWVTIFNGKDLTGWVPLIHKWKYNEDPYDTFRVDAESQVIRVTYEDYPGQSFDDHCGLLYYDKLLKDYHVRLTYRFREPQAKNPVSWGKNNSGLMLFGIDPKTVTNDPEFPPLIEIQLIGTPSSGGKNNGNLCQPGGMTVSKLFGQPLSDSSCHDSMSGTAPPADQWVTVEAEVHVSGDTKIFQYPDMTKPVLTISGPVYKGQPVTSGYLALQSESQPVEYKDIQLKELP